ncbi:hypothetical protein Drose_04270 [Dactylosporangium roseum]|uniref:Uncharacterized protein n=1 Tax=Dactylosporangium roseum TaxID=47989 RepID=A0ABY5Z623_9ACTN|nr:hypothetical protein [Dactylosporangium roseum]UWZ37505.1 hypothetical protein Drose_04270 [Dactylosporangium roseum]
MDGTDGTSATGGIVSSPWAPANADGPLCTFPPVSISDGRVTVTCTSAVDFAGLLYQLVHRGEIRLTGARGEDDGAAGVPAKVT